MNKQITKWLITIMVYVGLIVPVYVPVAAQGISPDRVSLFQLGRTDITLTGPFDSSTFSFGLPADWKLNGAGSFDLFMTVTYDVAGTLNGTAQAADSISGGILNVEFNRQVIGAILLDQRGDIQMNLPIPPEALASARADGRMEITFALDTGLSCLVDRQTTVVIRTATNFSLPHATVLPDTNLVNFPRPIYQASINPDAALLVLPDQPSSSELQSALTVASGLGNLTTNRVALDLVRIGQLSTEQKSNGHLIFVGKAGSLPVLSELALPLAATSTPARTASSGGYSLTGEDDGVVQMVNSPWDPAAVVLVVSGNTDAGVVKAAQAVSSGILRTTGISNLSLVTGVSPIPVSSNLPTDQTLVDLGYDGSLHTRRGANVSTYRFNIPPGSSVAGDSYFELAYSHSALLDLERSGVLISLNGRPLGSIKLTEQTAAESMNMARFTIPASAVVPGSNVLDVSFSLFPVVNCSVSGFQGLWARIWPDTRFHLPLGILPADITPVLGLDTYPAPFTFDSTLGSSAFVLQHDDIESWRLAVQLAGFLGDRANGALTTVSTFYADEITDEQKAGYHLLVIGRPSQQPIISDLRDKLPAPFAADSDIAEERNMQVSFRVQAETPVGYLESLPSPWNPDRLILAVLGNSIQGLKWSVDALLLPDLRSDLGGDFAVINGTQIVTADSRLSPIVINTDSTNSNTASESNPVSSVRDNPVIPKATLPGWVLPMMIISVILALLVVFIVVYGSWKRNRVRTGRVVEHDKV